MQSSVNLCVGDYANPKLNARRSESNWMEVVCWLTHASYILQIDPAFPELARQGQAA